MGSMGDLAAVPMGARAEDRGDTRQSPRYARGALHPGGSHRGRWEAAEGGRVFLRRAAVRSRAPHPADCALAGGARRAGPAALARRPGDARPRGAAARHRRGGGRLHTAARRHRRGGGGEPEDSAAPCAAARPRQHGAAARGLAGCPARLREGAQPQSPVPALGPWPQRQPPAPAPVPPPAPQPKPKPTTHSPPPTAHSRCADAARALYSQVKYNASSGQRLLKPHRDGAPPTQPRAASRNRPRPRATSHNLAQPRATSRNLAQPRARAS